MKVWPRAVAIMPTKDRPEMAHRAVHMFLEQDYPGEKHLLVFDDGAVPMQKCGECHDRFEYVRCDLMNLPKKRNAMMAHVNDPQAVYFLWDDDDYHGPYRMVTQVPAVEWHGAVLLRPTLYFNSITDDLRMSRWISDGTVAYAWEFWSRRRFNEKTDPGSGHLFVTHPRLVEQIPGDTHYMVVVHAGQRHTPPAFSPPDFTEAPLPASWARERLSRGARR